MAPFRIVFASAFIVLAATLSVHAEAENPDDGVTVEVSYI